jgi:hypothetical protein
MIMPNIEPDSFRLPELDRLTLPGEPDHAPRVLMLYGSLGNAPTRGS